MVPALPVESPALERSTGQERAPFTVLGIDSRDLTATPGNSSARYGITYPQVRDGTGDIPQGELGITGFPEKFLVDPQGRLAVLRLGPVTDDFLNATSSRTSPAGRGDDDQGSNAHWSPSSAASGLAARARSAGRVAPQLKAQATLPDIESEVMCPICGTPLELSASPQADRERAYIRHEIAKGKTKEPGRE